MSIHAGAGKKIVNQKLTIAISLTFPRRSVASNCALEPPPRTQKFVWQQPKIHHAGRPPLDFWRQKDAIEEVLVWGRASGGKQIGDAPLVEDDSMTPAHSSTTTDVRGVNAGPPKQSIFLRHNVVLSWDNWEVGVFVGDRHHRSQFSTFLTPRATTSPITLSPSFATTANDSSTTIRHSRKSDTTSFSTPSYRVQRELQSNGRSGERQCNQYMLLGCAH